MVGSVLNGNWIRTNNLLTFCIYEKFAIISREVLSRPGGKHIRVGRKFGEIGEIYSDDLVGDANADFNYAKNEELTSSIFCIGLNPDYEVAVLALYDKRYFGEVI